MKQKNRSRKGIKGHKRLYERDGVLLVKFHFEDRWHHPSTGLGVSPKNIEKAEKMLIVIESQIIAGTFDFAAQFPNSRSSTGAKKTRHDMTRSVAQIADMWWEAWQADNEPTSATLHEYRLIIENHIKPKIGHRLIVSIVLDDLLEWDRNLTHKKNPDIRLSDKKRGNCYTLAGRIFKYAEANLMFRDRSNPWGEFNAWRETRKGSLRKDKKPGRAKTYLEPFTKDERLRIEGNFPEIWSSERNMIGFNFAMGLRIGELLALAWEDINWEEKTVHVRMQRQSTYFAPCKSGSERILDISDQAMQFLKMQKEIAHRCTPVDAVVRESKKDIHGNHIETTFKDRHFIFFNSQTDSYYRKSGDFSTDKWPLILKRAKVSFYDKLGEKRVPYYTRHTFASRMLTAQATMDEIARELGNTREATANCYACLINEDRISSISNKNKYMELT